MTFVGTAFLHFFSVDGERYKYMNCIVFLPFVLIWNFVGFVKQLFPKITDKCSIADDRGREPAKRVADEVLEAR